MKLNSISIGMLAAFLLLAPAALCQDYKDPKAPLEVRVNDLLGKMTLDEKIDQLTGDEKTGFDTRENPRLGIPAFHMSDGPLGVRWFRSTAFPCGTAVAASWDTILVSRFGAALAEETRAHGRNYLLGPCVNIHRLPTGGRNFESYGEDPFLSGRLAVSYVKALQRQHVIPSVKHFALNNQEWRRTEVNVAADERVLREIYLPAFEAAVTEGGAWSVMSAYNKVNGWWCSENKHLLTEILKGDWGFKGLVVSDWGSTHSTVNAATNGLDLEMPEGGVFRPDSLKKAVQEGRVGEEVINDKVRRILRVKFMAGLFDEKPVADTTLINSPEHQALALDMARQGIVLLKNEKGILPLDASKIKRIAVIGPNAMIARYGGGGSSHVTPFSTVSPVEGIRRFLPDDAELIYAPGDELRYSPVPAIPSSCLRPDSAGGKGLVARYFGNKGLEGQPAVLVTDTVIDFDWEDKAPVGGMQPDNFSVRWTGWLAPPVTRKYKLYTVSDDGVRLTLDGKVLIDNWTDHGAITDSCEVELQAGRSYPVKIEFYENGGSAVMVLGWDLAPEKKNNPLLAAAVKAAKSADVAVICAGTSDSFESEGVDRIGGLWLPGNQDELISAVAKANPRTIVVLNTGSPVITKNWLGRVPALIEAFFPGQEGGTALGEILFGKTNPSGKLPFSFISGYEQTPAFKGYRDANLEAPYAEGIFVGYRFLEKNKMTPTYPFGHGLSYTTFSYSPLSVSPAAGGKYNVKLKVKNTGQSGGGEVVQLYVADGHSHVERPPKELKAFSRLYLEPGQEREVVLRLDRRSFAYYDVNGKNWKVEPGIFTLMAGSSSADIRQKATLYVK